MEFSSSGGAAILHPMPPKKSKASGDKSASSSGKHKKKRIGVNFDQDWHAAMRVLAAKRKMPVLWYLMDLVKADADANMVETPAPPWEAGKKSED